MAENFMVDFRQDKNSLYNVRPEESPLIEAALGLGEWLAIQAEISDYQRAAIEQMQWFLRNLPAAPSADFNGEFGFRFDHISQDIGHAGCWMVSVCRGVLEIFCNGREDLPEFEWLLRPGQSNSNDLATAQDWMAQVRNPIILGIQHHVMIIEAKVWVAP